MPFQNCGVPFYPSGGIKNLFGISSRKPTNFKLRRLSNLEINNSLKVILKDSSSPADIFLPQDQLNPYDNDIETQLVSAPLIEKLERMSSSVSTEFLTDTGVRDSVLPCRPSGNSDRSCMVNIVTDLSLKFFRYPQSSNDINKWTDLSMAQVGDDFYNGVDMLIRLLIMHPKFIYRTEELNPAVSTGYRVAHRLSFMIWGSLPDNELLDLAKNKMLNTKQQITTHALKMLSDDRSKARVKQFHAQWLAYDDLGHEPNLANSLKTEADLMVERTIFTNNNSWLGVFDLRESYMDRNVAQVYGLPDPGAALWQALPDDRIGILSTGAFLSAGAKFGDTSPTQRGKFIRNRLLCQIIPTPPPTINTDEPPESDKESPDCKIAGYKAHTRPGTSCFACHQSMDPIGFGLEQYDMTGQFRLFEKNNDGTDKESCPIDGAGNISEVGPFSGPLELSEGLLKSENLQSCMARQYYHFTYGKVPSPKDQPLMDTLKNKLIGGAKFKDIVLTLVGTDEFINGSN